MVATLFIAGALIAAPPHLPKQTPAQRAAVARAKASADIHYANGTRELMQLLGAESTKEWLRFFDDGSQLHNLPPTELHARLERELSAAELVHSFGTPLGLDGNCGMDVSLKTGVGQEYFFNQWLLQALGLIPVDPAENAFAEGAETHFFGFPPFRDVSHPDVATSTDRPVYAALNMYRNAAGNPQCGPVAAILSRTYVDGQAIAAPVDTGNYYAACGRGQTSGHIVPGMPIDCSAWRPSGGQLGIPGRLSHLLIPYVRFYNTSREVAGDGFEGYNLARLLIRLLSRETYRHPGTRRGLASTHNITHGDSHHDKHSEAPALLLNFLEDTWGYIEVNPAVTIRQDRGILMLVGTFDLWFATPNATALRAWCISRGWPLAWAHDPVDSTLRCTLNISGGGCTWPPRATYVRGIEPTNTRLLDPYVLARVPHGHNMTGGTFAHAASIFDAAWERANRTVPLSLDVAARRALMDAHWHELLTALWPTGDSFAAAGSQPGGASRANGPDVSLAVEPVWHGACANLDCVSVRVSDGACVCPLGPTHVD